MQIQQGMAAFVTGAGSGIGRGIAQRLAARGVAVGVADIRLDDARETASRIAAAGGRALAVHVDVSEPDSVVAAADVVEAAFGPVRIACNNAGVAMHGVPLHEIALQDWDWVIGVNVYGVIHGIRTFVPRMLAQDAPCHIVNTASIGGFQVNPNFLTAAYSMTKYAVVALSEGLQQELSGTGVGVSVLAPAAVETGIHLSARARPERLGGAYERPENHFMGDLIKGGMKPDEIGSMVVSAIEAGDFYIFPHTDTWHWLAARHDRIRQGFDRSLTAFGPPKAAE